MHQQHPAKSSLYQLNKWAKWIIKIIVVVVIVLIVSPGTLISLPIYWSWNVASPYAASITKKMGEITLFAYTGGYFILYILLLLFVYNQYCYRKFSASVATFIGFTSLFSCLYLIDFFVTTSKFLPDCWAFYLFSIFFCIVLFLDIADVVFLVECLVIAISVEVAYAIVFYVFDVQQFYTPHFGNRTSGTYQNPLVLYPVCLVGGPLSFSLSCCELSIWRRWGLRIVCGMCVVALMLSYTRAGWIALATSIVYVLLSPHICFSKTWKVRALLWLLVVGLIVGTVFIRTNGRALGNTQDRSSRGRLAIWRVAASIITDHPILGSGLGTYGYRQKQFMTTQLRNYNPNNVEAKSLYLNITAEFGFVGIFSFLLLAWQYVMLCKKCMFLLPSYSQAKFIMIGIQCGLTGVMIAGLVDTPILQSNHLPPTVAVFVVVGFACVVTDKTVKNYNVN